MAEPVLTQEELEAIYSAMKSDDFSQATIEDFPLTSGHAFITNAEQAWTDAAKRMSTAVTSIMVGAIGKRLTIEIVDAIALESSQDEGYDDLMSGGISQSSIGEDTSVITTANMGDQKMLIGVDQVLARRFVDRRTGADSSKEEEEDQAPPKPLTSLEHRLLKDLIRNLLNCAVDAAPQEIEASLDKEPAEDVWNQRDHRENWMLVRLSVSLFPGAGIWFRGPASIFVPKPKELKTLLSSHISKAQVVLAAELGHFSMSVQELWDMKPGTLIPLNVAVGDPFQIRIGGVVKMTGNPTISRGHIAVQIRDRMIRGDQQ